MRSLISLVCLLGETHENAVEILLLRQQIRILQRARTRPPRRSWWEKLPLTILAAQLIQGTMHARARLSQSMLLFSPETVLRWHRELVRRKWTFPHRRAAGRPRIAVELEMLIVRIARENPRSRIQ
jgi:putative transposase